MKKVTVKFWGVRGSIPRPSKEMLKFGGNTPCVEIRYGSELFICDCGTGIYPLGRSLIGKKLKATILLSHLHWDHIIGLPFFAPILNKNNRFRIIGNKNLKVGIKNLLSAPNFPVKFNDLPAKVMLEPRNEGEFRAGPAQIMAFEVSHPNGAFGYRFEFPNGKSVVYITDNSPKPDDSKLIANIYGADLLIHDAQYLPEEFVARKKFGHSMYNYLVELAKKADIKNVALFHHDPSRTDKEIEKIEKETISLGKKLHLKTKFFAARELLTIKL